MKDTGATIKGALEMQAEAFWDRLPQQWPPRSASQPAADDLHLGLRLQQGQVGPATFAAAVEERHVRRDGAQGAPEARSAHRQDRCALPRTSGGITVSGFRV